MTSSRVEARVAGKSRRLGFALLGSLAIGAGFVLGMSSGAQADTYTTPHGGNNMSAATGCAACHSVHRDTADTFTANNVTPRSLACFDCHDGTGANSIVSTQYNDAPANDPASRTYYSHPANATGTGHVTPAVDDEGGIEEPVNEFQGVSNRHSDCVDCHNPHNASTLPNASSSPYGWTLSGASDNVSIVEATWTADTTAAPTYSFIAHATGANYEYQLCLKCHSSFTTLSSNTGWARSKWYLDFGILLNPNNTSFHPITTDGKNKTTALANSLAGEDADTYHLFRSYTVDSLIACSNCHGATGGGTHATGNPNMLAYRYRSESLKPAGEAYDPAEYKLCFTCHSDKPFRGLNTTFTNFPAHYTHVVTAEGSGTAGGTVNTAGAGNGHALCVECHWESHSSALADSNQTLTGTRLVQFAPNVEPNNGVIEFQARNGATPGGCTLICHGVVHNKNDKQYP